jgi:chromatin segregation and condensation protein Rec8/ScpA/Scc1 (kleisin family)
LSGARPDPGPPLAAQLLADALLASIKLVPPQAAPPEIIARTITLEERAEVIRAALKRAPMIVLQDLLRDVTDRVVVAITFLAVLELAKGREVAIDQAEPWGPITVTPMAAKKQEAK